MIREIKLSDKKEVLRISSQIWEGDDYVSNVFDEWVTGVNGFFTGYWENEKLIGFGRMRFLTPTDIWLEALRKDPQTDVKGVGNKIAKYYMEQLKGKKIKSVRFSTYFGNIASIKLNEKLGFNKILTLSLKELEISTTQIKPINNSIKNDVDFKLLDQYILNSSYLKGTNNFISKGWVVYQYTSELLEEFHSKRQFAVYSENGEIKGAILFSEVDYNNVFWISLIEAENEKIYKELLNYAISRTLKKNCKKIQLLVPNISELLNFVDSIGFKSWEQN
ncbi:MAG: GNAT family N-acetyltransferase, partial [Candidatus Cloacimonetes bacterium]|nr:GNAT family N-acetyltransferase [Candidatus Cloacimonadota bacterium]